MKNNLIKKLKKNNPNNSPNSNTSPKYEPHSKTKPTPSTNLDYNLASTHDLPEQMMKPGEGVSLSCPPICGPPRHLGRSPYTTGPTEAHKGTCEAVDTDGHPSLV